MQIVLLGSGTPAPLPERQSAAVAVSLGDELVLFDAGRAATTQLERATLDIKALRAVFLTHHHYDHICGLGDLLLTAWHAGVAALTIVGPHGTAEIVASLVHGVYAREIAFSKALASALGADFRHPSEWLTVQTIAPGGAFSTAGWRVSAAAVDHGQALGLTFEDWPCLGYALEADAQRIVVSGDTVECDSIIELARDADVLIQCCHRAERAIVSAAHRLIDRHVIASSSQAGRIAARANVRTLVLTHLSPMTPDELSAVVPEVQAVFNGRVILGEDLLSLDL